MDKDITCIKVVLAEKGGVARLLGVPLLPYQKVYQ